MESLTRPIPPFDDAAGVWLRCALHVHTTETDGWLTPAVQRRFHAAAGYDVLSITDHDTLTPEPPGEDSLLVIPGTELSLRAPRSGGPLHLLGIGIERQPAVGYDATLAEAAEAVREAGGLPYVAHPVWSGLHTEEVEGIERCAGVEVYNACCGVETGRAHAGAHVDAWLSMGHRLNLIACDDTHYPGADTFRAWTMVHARERSRAAVVEALAAGRSYATTGPRILGLTLEGGVVTVRTTPAHAIAALSNPPYGTAVVSGRDALDGRGRRLPTADGHGAEGRIDGEPLTGATFAWTPGIRYLRIMVTDALGRRAWSNPIWADEAPPATP